MAAAIDTKAKPGRSSRTDQILEAAALKLYNARLSETVAALADPINVFRFSASRSFQQSSLSAVLLWYLSLSLSLRSVL